jgi:type IV fimbrial biogenesis protein FimT
VGITLQTKCLPSPSAEVSGRQDADAGFTLLELLVVMGVITIMAAITVPSMLGAISHTKLRAASSDLAGLLQSGRVQAIKRNRTITVEIARRSDVPFAFVTNVDASVVGPEVQLGASTMKVGEPAGTPPALTAAVLSFTPVNDKVSFSPRGLPCKYAAGKCTAAGFVYYLMDSSQPKAWTAVSISPGGRIKQWFWNGVSWVD